MVKKLVKNNSKNFDYENYMLGDPLFDLLREYYRRSNELNSSTWRNIVDNDRKNIKAKKKKEINDLRRYK